MWPHPGGKRPWGCRDGVEKDGQGPRVLFHYKRNFLGLVGHAEMQEGPGGRVFGETAVLCSDCGCSW